MRRLDDKSRMSREVHVRICERLGVKLPRATRLVIVCRSKTEAERALETVRWIMGKLKLTLHPTKTHVVDLGREGFEFLGFHFHKRRVRKTGKLLPYFW